MFILSNETPAEWCAVSWTGVAMDGEPIENSIEVKFLRHGRARLGEIYAGSTGQAEADAPVSIGSQLFGDIERDVAFLKAVASDWRGIGVVDRAGKAKPLPFTDANIRLLLDDVEFVKALATAHIAFARGARETRRGNSKPSPAGGQATGRGSVRPVKAARANRRRSQGL